MARSVGLAPIEEEDLTKKYRALKKKEPKMSFLVRRGLEKLEESGKF